MDPNACLRLCRETDPPGAGAYPLDGPEQPWCDLGCWLAMGGFPPAGLTPWERRTALTAHRRESGGYRSCDWCDNDGWGIDGGWGTGEDSDCWLCADCGGAK